MYNLFIQTMLLFYLLFIGGKWSRIIFYFLEEMATADE